MGITRHSSGRGQLKLSGYLKVCDVADVPIGSMHPVDVAEKRLMIVNVNGQLYATDRICTHEEADLSTGFLMGSMVTCPLHLSRFDVVSGEVQNAPASVPLKTYGLKVEGTNVYVQL
jgi:nitrite reductase/ring-hydroxylating ferredoxin subunit